jgi:hypothetical protein
VEKVIIAKMGVEGGGVTIFGHRVGSLWSFWQEGTSMYMDENGDEVWPSWASVPVSELALALPDEWYMMYPTEVNQEFVVPLRIEYERCNSSQVDGGRAGRSQHKRWLRLLAGQRQDS